MLIRSTNHRQTHFSENDFEMTSDSMADFYAPEGTSDGILNSHRPSVRSGLTKQGLSDSCPLELDGLSHLCFVPSEKKNVTETPCVT